MEQPSGVCPTACHALPSYTLTMPLAIEVVAQEAPDARWALERKMTGRLALSTTSLIC